MAYEYTASGDVSGPSGNRVDQPGTYHVLVTDANDTPTKRDGTLIADCAFRLVCGVLAGTVDGQKDKEISLIFNTGRTHKDGGEFAGKIIGRAILALGLAPKETLETKGAKIPIDFSLANGRQCIVKLEGPNKDGYMNLDGLHIYHVDDSAAAAFPKCKDSLSLIDPKLRWTGDKAKAASKATAPVAVPASGNGAAAAAAPTSTMELV